MGFGERLRALRTFHTGCGSIKAAGGPVAMVRFGPARLLAPFVVVTSPQGAHDVLGGSGGAFDKMGLVHVESRRLGPNVFNLPEEPWRPRRRALQPVFTKHHVKSFAGRMAGNAETSVDQWIGAGRVDLDEKCRQLTLRVIGESVFGYDMAARAAELAPAIRTVFHWVIQRATRPVRAPRGLPTPARHRVRAAVSAIRSVVDTAVEGAADDPTRDAELIRRLFATSDPETGRPLTRDEIGDELIAFLVAGHDTTATILAYSLWSLGRDSRLQDQVAAEVREVGDRQLTVDDIGRLDLTTRVVHEALRMCPPAAAISRMTMRDAVVDGFRIPAGTNVIVGVYTLHHDPELWDDPETFDPDRFTPARSVGRNRWQYLPFGGGPRTCIGDHFAMLEAVLGLATIVRAAEIESLNDEFPLALPFTMTAGAPIPARVLARVGHSPR